MIGVVNVIAIHRHITGEDNSGLASLVAETSGEVAVSIAGILTRVGNLLRVRVGDLGVALKGIHDGTLQAAERRGLIGERVVVTVIGRAGGTALRADDTEGVREGRHITEVADRAGIRSDGGEAAGVQSTVGTGDVHLSFTAEETAVLAGDAVIRVEAGFENEANLGVADIFRALQAPAVAGGEAGFHRERVGRVDTSLIGVQMGVSKARIDAAVQRDGRSSESGCRESAKQSSGNERLLHEIFSSSLNVCIANYSFKGFWSHPKCMMQKYFPDVHTGKPFIIYV